MWFWWRRWFSPEPALVTPSLAWRALDVAQGELGQGEFGNINNRTKYASKDGPWCAAFLVFCFRQAAAIEGVEVPFRLSNGAKRLYKNVGAAGSFFTSPALARPGDVVCWDRGRQGSWKGHVGIVEHVDVHGLVHTIEGNVGAYPAKVSRFKHDTSYERLVGFARLP